MLSFKLDIKLMPAPRPRLGTNCTYNPANYTEQKKYIQNKIRAFKKWESDVSLSVDLLVVHKTPKNGLKRRKHPFPIGDADNMLKGLLDAMNGIIYVDDTQVTEAKVKKMYGDIDAIFVKVSEN